MFKNTTKIVQFNDGSYGVRCRGIFFFNYLAIYRSIEDNPIWFGGPFDTKYIYQHCRYDSIDSVSEAFAKLKKYQSKKHLGKGKIIE